MAGRKKLPIEKKKIRIEPFIEKQIVDQLGKKECELISVGAVNKEYLKFIKLK
jgi:hypothetical protein